MPTNRQCSVVQAIWRQVSTLGFVADFRDPHDDSVRLAVRRLMALGFAPFRRVPTAFVEIETRSPPRLQPLFQYFRQQWLISIRPIMWNVYGESLRTNNDLEGWHRRFNGLVNKHHPNLWHFTTILLTEQAATDVVIQQIAAGQQVQVGNAKYNKLNARIKRLHERYVANSITVMELITGIGHVLHQF